MSTEADELTPDDRKLVSLARGARARIQAATGAAVRDDTGRTYAGADVDLPSLRVSAVELAVAQSVAAGAAGIEAIAVVGALPADWRSALRAAGDLSGGTATVILADCAGTVERVARA
jgi:hypothetical protein